MTFKTEKGVAPPRQKHPKYPFAEMDVGDSFLIPCDAEESERARSSVRSVASGYAKTLPKGAFSIATKCGPDGVRVWRMK